MARYDLFMPRTRSTLAAFANRRGKYIWHNFPHSNNLASFALPVIVPAYVFCQNVPGEEICRTARPHFLYVSLDKCQHKHLRMRRGGRLGTWQPDVGGSDVLVSRLLTFPCPSMPMHSRGRCVLKAACCSG
jgi:hypothetical protein